MHKIWKVIILAAALGIFALSQAVSGSSSSSGGDQVESGSLAATSGPSVAAATSRPYDWRLRGAQTVGGDACSAYIEVTANTALPLTRLNLLALDGSGVVLGSDSDWLTDGLPAGETVTREFYLSSPACEDVAGWELH